MTSRHEAGWVPDSQPAGYQGQHRAAGDLRGDLPETWKLATMSGTARETMIQAQKARDEIAAAIAALDRGDDWPPR